MSLKLRWLGTLLLLALPPLWADTIYKYDGTVLKGKIIAHDEYYVTMKITYGKGIVSIVRIDREDIARITFEKSPEEIHEERLKKCKTAEDYYRLGKWAQSKKLPIHAIKDFERALELDPNYKPAHLALGHKFYRGRWWTKEEYNEKVLGLVYRQGRWMTKAQARRLEEELRRKQRERVQALWKKRRQAIKGISWPEALQNPITTEHYIVYCNASKELAKQYADFLELLFDKFDQIFKRYRSVYQSKIKKYKSIVMIHKTYEEFLNMHGLEPGVGGFYRPIPSGTVPARSVIAYHGSFGDTGNTFNVLAHEGTHQFEHLLMPTILNRPIWLIEGLAVYFGDGHKFENGKLTVGVIPRDRLSTLQQAIRLNRYIPLRQLLRTPHQRFSGFHYAHAWGLIYYMMNGKHPKVNMKKVFMDFFDLNCRKTFYPDGPRNTIAMARHFEQSLGVNIQEFEESWKKYIMSLPLGEVGEQKGKYHYISKSMKFQIERPHKRHWKFDVKNLQRGEKLAIVNEKTTGRIAVIATGNTMAYSAKDIAKNLRFSLYQRYKKLRVLRFQEYDHKGYPGFEIVFQGIPRQTNDTGLVRDKEQKYRLIILATPDHYYILKFQADVNKFFKNKKSFAFVLKRFELLVE
ncbi:MAG: DUF1570 domain-containing protein [Planctomycetota bacterium]|nr:MAG: DUF1570 domain-containing protein [Planctomycetota bacterium]